MQALANLVAAIDALTAAVDRVVAKLGDAVPAADVQAQADRVAVETAKLDAAAPPA